MPRVSSKQYKIKIIPTLFSAFMVLLGALYSGTIKAETSPQQAPGTQLAWFVGYHNYYGGGYYRPNYVNYGPKRVYSSSRHKYKYKYRAAHWNGKRFGGYTCKKTCLINNWDGRFLGCKNICF